MLIAVIRVRDASQPFERMVRALEPLTPTWVVDDGCRRDARVGERAEALGARALRHPAPRGRAAVAALAVALARREGAGELVLVDANAEPSVAAALVQGVRPLTRGRARALWARAWRAVAARVEARLGLPEHTLALGSRRIAV